MHHRQSGIGFQVALELVSSQSRVKNGDGVIRRAAAGRVGRNHPGETQTPEVHTESLVIIFAKELGVHLLKTGNSVKLAAVWLNFATPLLLNAFNLVILRDNLMINPIFGLLSSRAI